MYGKEKTTTDILIDPLIIFDYYESNRLNLIDDYYPDHLIFVSKVVDDKITTFIVDEALLDDFDEYPASEYIFYDGGEVNW